MMGVAGVADGLGLVWKSRECDREHASLLADNEARANGSKRHFHAGHGFSILSGVSELRDGKLTGVRVPRLRGEVAAQAHRGICRLVAQIGEEVNVAAVQHAVDVAQLLLALNVHVIHFPGKIERLAEVRLIR